MTAPVVDAPQSNRGRAWWFLDTLVVEHAMASGWGPVVLEQTLPLGAAPPRHVHHDLDDSWYLLEGQMVVQCGEEMLLATPGHWVSMPRDVPHAFRVVGDTPARALLVHNNDSFLGLVRDIGELAGAHELPAATGGPGFGALSRAILEHDATVVGDSLSEEQAQTFLAGIGRRAPVRAGGDRL